MTKIEVLKAAIKTVENLQSKIALTENYADQFFLSQPEIQDAIDNLRSQSTELLALFAKEFAHLEDDNLD